jgi:hypothetical protein
MSYDIFKQNMLSYMRNQRAIGSKEDFAKKLVQEYDSLVHKGYDMINKITVSTGNTELMESTLIGVLNTAFQQSAGEHPLYTNLGPVFQAYWTGATMNLFPPPLPTAIPAPAIHIAQVSNSITNTGTWNGRDNQVIPPEETEEDGVDDGFDNDLENQSLQENLTLLEIEEEEDDQRQGNTEFSGYAINFGGGNVERAADTREIRRGAARSNQGKRNTRGRSTLSDSDLFQLAGRGELWPAKGTPGNFEISKGPDAGGRIWYVHNPEFIKKYITNLNYRASGVDYTTPLHVDLVKLIQPAFDEIKSLGLDIYLAPPTAKGERQHGGFAVRNVTGGTSLSNHAWGCGMDMNTAIYPWKTQFKDDGIYNPETGIKKRDYNEFDLGYCKVVEIILKHGGGVLQWLTSHDAMHISLYEGVWNGKPSFVKPFG